MTSHQRDRFEFPLDLEELRTWAVSASDPEIMEAAESLARVRELEPYPGWYFGIEESDPTDQLVPMRLELWQEGRRRQLKKPIVVPWHYGLQLPLWLGNDMSRCMFVGTCIEPNELAYVNSVVERGMVVLDGGANEGFYSLLSSKLSGASGQVFAVEPSPREHERLETAISENRLQNITSLQVALSDRRGTGQLKVADNEHSGQNTLGAFAYEGVTAIATAAVELVTIDEVVSSSGLDRLDLVKLDLEGAELNALRGAHDTLDRFRPLLLLEFSAEMLGQQGGSDRELLELLSGHSYTLLAFDEKTGLPSASQMQESPSSNIVAVPTR